MTLAPRASPEQLAFAQQLLEHEAASDGAVDPAEIATRVYEKLLTHLAPIVGNAGVRTLLVRSATLARRDFACLAGVAVIENSTELRERLQRLDPVVANEAARALIGTFIALITTFIGDRLATQVLRTAWPKLEAVAPTETSK